MFKPHFLNSLIITFLFLSISGPDRFLTTFKQSFTENLMTIIKETFGFISVKCPPTVSDFESEFTLMVNNIEFWFYFLYI